MTINKTVNIRAGMLDKEQQTGKFGVVSVPGGTREEKKENGSSMLLNGQFDPVEQKKALAKKQAYKIVKDALANELKMDSNVQEVKDHARQLQAEMENAQEEIGKIDEKKEALRIDSGVEADSEEQKDLELLEKRAAYERGDLSKALTKEESKRAAELDARGYTEYQKQALAMEKHKAPYENTIDRARAGIISDNAVIRGTRLERLKKDFIRKAQNEKDDMLAAASEEIVGMLVAEAKDHMDEKSKELQEKAEEKTEKEEAEQEKLDAIREKKEQLEEMADPEKNADHASEAQTEPTGRDQVTEAMVQLEGEKADYQQEIEDMVRKMGLVAEDIKGIKVDEIF